MGGKGKALQNKPHRRAGAIAERKRAEGTLPESGEYYLALVENLAEAVLVSRGVIIWCNDRVEEVLGYSKDELIGTDGSPLFLENVNLSEWFGAVCRVKEERGRFSGAANIRKKDGSTIEVEFSTSRVQGKEPPEFVTVIRDVTGRKLRERERREEAVERSEQYFRSLLENSLGAIAVVSGDGAIRYESPSFERMLGYKLEDRIGGNSFDLVHPDDMQKVVEVFAQLIQNPCSARQIELRCRHKDGSWRFIEAIGNNLLDDPTVAGFVANFHDITERKQMEEALRESEDKFRSFVEEMNDGYCVIQGFTVMFANARIAEMFGYTQEEVIGRTIDEFLPAMIVEGLAEVHARRKRGEAVPRQYETVLTSKDGSERPVEFGARLMAYAGKPAVSVVIRDISERKELEKALRESEARFRKIFEEAAIGISLVAVDGKPLAINPALQRMLGYSLEEFSNMLPSDYLHSEDVMVDAHLFREMVAGKREDYQVEKRCIRKNGEIVWANQTLSLVRDDEGKPQFIIAMTEDITRRRMMEQQLQLTGRLAAVGELAAGVAHELNNPLTAVQAFAQLLNDRDDLDETTKSDVKTIYREAQRATRITGNLLSFAYKHEPERSLISINEVVEKSLELYAYQMEVNRIDVATDLAPDIPMTMADFHQMQQVFVNLITNAGQAMTEAHGRGKLCVSTRRLDKTIQIAFVDDGPGISEGDLERMFDPFFTTKEVGRGTGLGLSICYGIVEGHGGHISVQSRLGEGATFLVEVPVVSNEQPVLFSRPR